MNPTETYQATLALRPACLSFPWPHHGPMLHFPPGHPGVSLTKLVSPRALGNLRLATCDQSENRITDPLGPRGSDFLNSDQAEFQFSDHRYWSCSESCPSLLFRVIHSHGNFNWSILNMTFRGTTLIAITELASSVK